MKQILLTGGYGYQDIGDEAQLTASLLSLKRFLPKADIIILSDNPQQTENYHRTKIDFSIRHCFTAPLFGKKAKSNKVRFTKKDSTSRSLNFAYQTMLNLKTIIIASLLIFNAKRIKKEKRPLLLNQEQKHFFSLLHQADLLFNVGGGNITSVWRSEFHMKCLTFLLCRILDKPVVLSGQTIGPFQGKIDRWIAKYSLNNVNVITLRENYSKINLQQIGINKPIIVVTADDSVQLPPASPKAIKSILKNEKINAANPLIGMNVFGVKLLQKTGANIKKTIQLFVKTADYLVEKYNATIIFIGLQYGECDDRVTALKILKSMKNKERAYVVSQELTAAQIKGLLGLMDIVIGFRYHFLTFAVDSGIPAIGLYSDDYYATKIQGVLSLVGLEKNAINLKNANFRTLVDLTDEIFYSREKIRQQLLNRAIILKNLSLLSAMYAARLLESINER